LTAFLGLASVLVQTPVAAQADASGVAGAAQAFFPDGTTVNGVPLSGFRGG